jgi:energy-coupling factor transport system permease protein
MRYIEGDSFLHRLSPMSKLLTLVLLCLSLFIFESWQAAVGLVAFLVLLYVPGPLGATRLFGVLRPLPLFIVIIIAARAFLVDRALPLEARLLAGALQALRVAGLVIAVHLFLSVTDPVSLSDAVMEAVWPLRRTGVRAGELSLTVMIVFSFIPFMTAEVKRLQVAQAVRCGFPKPGWSAVRAAVPLVVPLVVGVLRRTDELELALAARCYSLDAPRRGGRSIGGRRLDYVVSAAGVALFVGGLYLRFS